MTPYERSLEALAQAETKYARTKSLGALALVLRARKLADKRFRESFGTDQDPTPGPRPTIGNRR
jgi:hypothetical protein